MDAVNRKSRFLFMKYLLIAMVLMAVIIILATLTMVTLLGNSGSGYAVGVSADPKALSILGLQLLSSMVIAYFVAPGTVKAIREGQKWVYVGIKSLLICWAAPWIVIALIASISDLSWDAIVFIAVALVIPSLLVGPIVGRALKKKIAK